MNTGYTGLPKEVFEERVDKLRELVSERGVDGVFLFSDEYRPGNTVYVSDYKPINVIEESPQGIFVPNNGDVVLFLGAINAQAARKVTWIKDVRHIEELGSFFSTLRERLNKGNLKLGLVGEALLPAKYYKRLLEAVDQSEIVDVDDILTEMREVKTNAEVELMREAARLGDISIEKGVARLREASATEIQIAAEAEYAFRALEGDIGSATVLSSGMNTESPTWRPTSRKIDNGDAVLIDMSPSYRGYCTDVAVTVFNGGLDDAKRRILDFSAQVLRDVVGSLHAGAQASVIYEFFLKRVKEKGYEDYFLPYAKGLRAVGHSVGLDVVERPNLGPDSNFPLRVGMTLGVKFDLHGFDFGGIRMEEVVLIGEERAEPLNRIFESSIFDFAGR